MFNYFTKLIATIRLPSIVLWRPRVRIVWTDA